MPVYLQARNTLPRGWWRGWGRALPIDAAAVVAAIVVDDVAVVDASSFASAVASVVAFARDTQKLLLEDVDQATVAFPFCYLAPRDPH